MPSSLLSRVLLAITISSAALAPGLASAKSHRHHSDSASTTESGGKRRGAQSIGSPNHGHLEGGVRLKPTSHLKVRAGANAWAHPTLSKLLHHAADRVASKYKGSVLLVGDLSAKNGGALEGHNSHQSGRDADVAFYVANTKGKPANVRKFLAFNAEGTSKDIAWARFDDERNWMLVEELLKDEHANVRYVFVSNALRARLLKYAASKKVSKDMIARASAAMMSPEHADLHDDHFHVRIACPESSNDCVAESRERDVTAPESSPSDAPAAPSEAPAENDPY